MSLVVVADPAPFDTDADGVVRVGGTRVTLDTLVAAFHEGASPETIADQYPEEVYTRGFRVYTTIRKADQEAAYIALRKGVLEYDRQHGYRAPEGYVELPGTVSEDDYDDLLADHPDSDNLLAAVVLSADPKQVQVALRTGEKIDISGEGLRFAAHMRIYVDQVVPCLLAAADGNARRPAAGDLRGRAVCRIAAAAQH